MALIKAAALGAIAAISIPHVLRAEPGALGRLARYGAVTPLSGEFGIPFSLPIFLVVAGLGWLLLKASER